MAVPDAVGQQVQVALAAMRADPHHRLAPAQRRAIYAAFGAPTAALSQRARGWLAVLAAQRVLPLWHRAFPDDALPPQMLAMAIALLQGTGDARAAAHLQDQGYHASGNTWGYAEEDVPWPVDLAGAAAYHALSEALGQAPLTGLAHYAIIGTVVLPGGSPASRAGHVIRQDPPPSGDHFSDEDLCHLANADTAGVAAVATACLPDRPQCDPAQLQAFWEWWLLEAIPVACARAQAAARGAG